MTLCRKITLCALITLLAFPAYADNFVPGEVVVVLKDSGTDTTASFAAASGMTVKEVYSSLSEAGGNVYALFQAQTDSPDKLARELLQNPQVLAASPNYKVYASVIPNDTSFSSCWGMDYINAPAAWDMATGSDTVYVAILDSGIDNTNPDLTDNVTTRYGSNFINPNNSTMDDYGHGTHVAGIIGASANNSIGIAGINWHVQMIPVKVLDNRGEGTVATVISGMNYVTNLMNQGLNIRAVNLSLETYLTLEPTHNNLVTFPLWRAFKDLDALNQAVITVAAGNYSVAVGQPTTNTRYSLRGELIYNAGDYVYPASFQGIDNLISVGAVNSDGDLASFSNTGADLLAPGVNILSTWLQSSTRNVRDDGVSLTSQQGTSMAAPFVAGTAALLSSVMPGRTGYQLKRAILGGMGADGVLDVEEALYYQSDNTNLPEASSEWTSYRDYQSYTPSNQTTTTTNNDSSSGCNGASAGIFALLAVIPLLRKYIY